MDRELSKELEEGKMRRKKKRNIKMVKEEEENAEKDMVVWFSG